MFGIDCQKLARLMLPIDPMPQGALLIYEKETMKPGTIVELENNKPASRWKAHPGAQATVVGPRRFPDLYDQLEAYLRNFGRAKEDMAEFVWVSWDRSDPKWNGQADGAYSRHRFRVVAQAQEPKNNDGRAECFWCPGVATAKRGGGQYDVCPKCGR
jgi:hypothetical protein